MMTEPLSEYGRTRLELAEEMLADAKALYNEGRLRSAADRAYYSIFHAAQAALAKHGLKAPRPHKGLRSQFGEQLIATGILERGYSRDLTKALEMRQESTYEAYGSVTGDEVADLIARAEKSLQRIRAFVMSGKRA